MKHDAALISAYHDGVLPPSKRRQVEGHIRVCDECRALLSDFQAMRKGMQSLQWQQAPSGMLEQIKAQAAVERRRQRRATPVRPMAGVAASFAAAAAAFFAGTMVAPASPLTTTDTRPVVSVAVPAAEVNAVPRDSVIELQFNAPVDRGSVEQSLRVSPPLAAHLEWQDDRLRIVPSEQLDTEATYTIAVAPTGQEADGPSFTTQVRADTSGNSAPAGAGPAAAPVTPPPAGGPLVQSSNVPAATPTAASPQATPTPTWALSALSAGGAATAVQTCTIARSAGLARLASERPDLFSRLGCAAAPEVRVTVAEQQFETGALVWRADLRWTYALQSQPRRWTSYSDSSTENLPPESASAVQYGPAVRPATGTPGAGRSTFLTATATPPSWRENPAEPSATFLRLWRAQPDLRNLIGGPVRGERQGPGVVQDFQHGLAVITEWGGVYTLFGDRAWSYLPASDEHARVQRPLP